MIRMEFNTYQNDMYYFLYITEEVRIETYGVSGIQLQTRDSRVRNLGDPFQYLTLRERKDEYFNESLINPYVDEVIKAVEVLVPLLTLDD
ncbi:hypothetical protein AAHY20_17160 [Klebsiella quasipneumoniae subsp. similipneumoniae]|uniref:hypothetical protein n=1 Tax=Klebsiella quasipneumoniae TaxID=1463165 RepID=UPI0029892B67|nr:hypothetical protein [Klebsiella quasipneumoniae subsp. similipneumoniae]HCI4628350.1 hypothetical protein [Klebsiella quasipneumoniae subsp. similipneumoniae]